MNSHQWTFKFFKEYNKYLFSCKKCLYVTSSVDLLSTPEICSGPSDKHCNSCNASLEAAFQYNSFFNKDFPYIVGFYCPNCDE